MCGLVGILDAAADPAESATLVRRMAATLAHRGPDGEGFYAGGPCALGFQRLAIVDLAAPSPPFANEDRTVWSAANAEIYNGDELRAELEQRGHIFETRVDTEVIPHLWEEDGADLVAHLNGMFALVVWDAGSRTLLLARDLRALLVHPRISATVDAVALRRYLLHDFFPAPWTPIAGVRKLAAGHLLVARRGEITVRSYWDQADHFDPNELARRRRADVAEELDQRIGLAIERRRRSDVPIGVFLSGGIDSSTVLAHTAAQHGPGVPVFALGHRDREFDESRFARETSRFFDADFHELILDESDLADGLKRVGEGFDEPLGDASTLPTHLLSRFARERVKVVLSGEGADELFAGYPTYIGHRLARSFGRLPGFVRRGLVAGAGRLPNTMGNVSPGYLLRRFAAAAARDPVERHHLWFGSLAPALHAEVLAPRILDLLAADDPFASARARLAGRSLPDELARLLYTDFTMYLQDDLLTKVDRATMLTSLEARAPFLDHELVEFAAAIPSAWKLDGLTTKAILRRAVRKRLPKQVLGRRKRGFNIPFSRWLLHGLGDELRRRFTPDRISARGLLSPAGVRRLLDEDGAPVPVSAAGIGADRPVTSPAS
jgi:asparagine synthase (glutamine-hydrolysing)